MGKGKRGKRRRREQASQRGVASPPESTPPPWISPENRAWLGRVLTNAFLCTILALFTIDALPAGCSLHENLQEDIDPLLDVTGLWQARWKLFSPEPDMANTWVELELTLDDGSVHTWRSPRWDAMSQLERMRRFRQMEYWDSIRLDGCGPAWGVMARYFAETEGRRLNGGKLPKQVKAWRHWNQIKPPPPELGLLDPIDTTVNFEHGEYNFHLWSRDRHQRGARPR